HGGHQHQQQDGLEQAHALFPASLLLLYFQPPPFASSLIGSACTWNQRLPDGSEGAPSPTVRTAHATFPPWMGGSFASDFTVFKTFGLPLSTVNSTVYSLAPGTGVQERSTWPGPRSLVLTVTCSPSRGDTSDGAGRIRGP